jgi:hypothetical protein
MMLFGVMIKTAIAFHSLASFLVLSNGFEHLEAVYQSRTLLLSTAHVFGTTDTALSGNLALATVPHG